MNTPGCPHFMKCALVLALCVSVFAGEDQLRPVLKIVLSSRLSATPNPAPAGSAVTLNVGASELSGQPLTYTWDFGDGTADQTDSGSIAHTYTAGGYYVATVSISNGQGYLVSDTRITVNAVETVKLALRAGKSGAAKFAPFETAQIGGTFDHTKHHYSVGFVFSKDKKTGEEITAKVPVLADQSTTSELTVTIPPFIGSKGYKAGKASVYLITDGVKSSDEFAVAAITDLPKVKNKKLAGCATLSYLRSNKNLLTTMKSKLASNVFIGASTLNSIDDGATRLSLMYSEFHAAVNEKKKDKTTMAALNQSDRLVLGILNAGAQVTEDSGFAAGCNNMLNGLSAAKTYADPVLLTAESSYVGGIATACGAGESTSASTASGGRGAFSTFFKAAAGILTVTAVGVATVATVAGGTAAGAAVLTGVGVATVVIGATAAVSTAVVGTAAYLVGAKKEGKMLLGEAKQIGVDTAVSYGTENLPAVAGAKLLTTLGTSKNVAEGVKNVVGTTISVQSAVSDIQTTVPELQTSGSFTAAVIPSGSSYYIAVTGIAGHALTATVTGSDGYTASFSGTGSIKSSVIPAGASGVNDTVVCKDTVTGETKTFNFKF